MSLAWAPMQYPVMPTPLCTNSRRTLCTLTTPSHSSGKDTLTIAFFIWTDTADSLNVFLDYLNSCNSNITFTFEKFQQSVHFMDTTVNLEDNNLRTDFYSKPTDSHNYLFFTSSHPNKCEKNIHYLRVRQICSTVSDLDKHMKNMTLHVLDRGYTIDLLQDAATKSRRMNRYSLHNPTACTNLKNTEHSILVTTHHPEDVSLKQIVTNN